MYIVAHKSVESIFSLQNPCPPPPKDNTVFKKIKIIHCHVVQEPTDASTPIGLPETHTLQSS